MRPIIVAILFLLLSNFAFSQRFEDGLWKDSSSFVTNIPNLVKKEVQINVPFLSLSPIDSQFVAFNRLRLFVEYSTGRVNQIGNGAFSSTIICDVFLAGNGLWPEVKVCSGLSLTVNQNGTTLVKEVINNQMIGLMKQFGKPADSTLRVRKYTRFIVRMRSISTTSTSVAKATLEASHLGLRTWYELDASVDVSTKSVKLVHPGSQVQGDGLEQLFRPTAGFAWKMESPFPVPAYRLQLLKLENQADPDATHWRNGVFLSGTEYNKFKNGTLILIRKPDWSKALEVRIDGNTETIPLTLNQGTGFYAWRVQAVGNVNGDPFTQLNATQWSVVNYSSFYRNDTISNKYGIGYTKVGLKDTMAKLRGILYFQDPDSAFNKIHSRIFQEGNRQKEIVQYGNGLDKIVQTQTYLPSLESVLHVGSAYDYSGRKVVESLPSPEKQKNGLNGYKKGLLKPGNSNTGRSLNAEHFDKVTNVKNQPALDVGNQSAWNYYESEPGVAKTGGYPYQRTVFKNGSADKVAESGGFGPEFAVKPGGHTSKTLYSTPSQSELDGMFGKLAPKAEKIRKIIQVDPNGTSSSSFQTPDGKTIATSLGFYDTLKFDKPIDAPSITTVDAVASNRMEGNILVSARQLAFNRRSVFGVDYRFQCNDFSVGCFKVDVSRIYVVNISISRTDGKKLIAKIGQSQMPDAEVDFKLTSGWSISADSSAITIDSILVSCSGNNTFSLGTIELPAGSYSVQKVLHPKNDPQITITQVDNSVKDQTKLFVDAVTRWGEELECDFKPQLFISKLRHIADSLNKIKSDYANKALDNLGRTRLANLSNFLLGRDTTFFTLEHGLELFPDASSPNMMIFTSSCCRLTAPIRFATAFNCDSVGYRHTQASVLANYANQFSASMTSTDPNAFFVNPYLGRHPELTEITPDLEGFAFEYLWDCVKPADSLKYTLASDTNSIIDQHLRFVRILNGDRWRVRCIWDKFLRPFMPGYLITGTFNLMVNKMLLDTIPCDGIGRRYLVDTAGRGIVYNEKPVVEEFPIYESPDSTFNSCQQKMESHCSSRVDTINRFAFHNFKEPTRTKLGFIQSKEGGCKAYDCRVLFNCFLTQLNYVRNQIGCSIGSENGVAPNQVKFETSGNPPRNFGSNDGNANISQGVDDENEGDRSVHDNHLNNNIKFKKPWYMGRKKYNRILRNIKNSMANIVRQSQGQPTNTGSVGSTSDNVNCDPSLAEDNEDSEDMDPDVNKNISIPDNICDTENCDLDPDCIKCKKCTELDNSDSTTVKVKPEINYHLVHEFLNCAGHRFAKILTDDDANPFIRDMEPNANYSVPAFENYQPPVAQYNVWTMGLAGGLSYYEGKPRNYRQLDHQWHAKAKASGGNSFEYVNDPIYAYKYFEYTIDLFPELEISTCFRNPNQIRYGKNDYRYISTTDTLIRYCETGLAKVCLSTMRDWSCSQRYAFYQSLKMYPAPDSNNIFKSDPNSLTSSRAFLASGVVTDQTQSGYDTLRVKKIFNFIPNKGFNIVGKVAKQKRYLFQPYDTGYLATYTYNPRYSIMPKQRMRYYSQSSTFVNEAFRTMRKVSIPEDYSGIYDAGMRTRYVTTVLGNNGWVAVEVLGDTMKTLAEILLQEANNKVGARCDADRVKIRQMLANRFIAQGFEIRDCITQCDSVVTPTDLDKLAEAYVHSCKTRGMVTTFSIDSSGCRSIMTHYRYKGLHDYFGQVASVPELVIGTADTGADLTSCGCERAVMYAQAPLRKTLGNLGELVRVDPSPSPPPYEPFHVWNNDSLNKQRSLTPGKFEKFPKDAPRVLSTWVDGKRFPIYECATKINRQALRMQEVLFGQAFVNGARVTFTKSRFWSVAGGDAPNATIDDSCHTVYPPPCPTCNETEGFLPVFTNATEGALPGAGGDVTPGTPVSQWTTENMILKVRIPFRSDTSPSPEILSTKTISKKTH